MSGNPSIIPRIELAWVLSLIRVSPVTIIQSDYDFDISWIIPTTQIWHLVTDRHIHLIEH